MRDRKPFVPPAADPQDHELVNQLKRIRFDLTDLQGKVSEALRMAGALNLEPHTPHTCPECKAAGNTFDLRTATKLAEHRFHSHDGPLPDHYQTAERLADDA
jgi:hypothetical protein